MLEIDSTTGITVFSQSTELHIDTQIFLEHINF